MFSMGVYFIFILICLSVLPELYLCTTYMPDTLRGQRRALGTGYRQLRATIWM